MHVCLLALFVARSLYVSFAQIMTTRYCVYLVTGFTVRGTLRRYIGYTRSLVLRRYWQNLPEKPAWMRCLRSEGKTYTELRTGLTSLADALLEEAIQSARLISKYPLTTRGGPWSSPKRLTDSQLDVIRQVAACKTAEDLYPFTADGRNALARHLANVSFECVEENDVVAQVRMRTSNRSGTPGNKVRRSHIYENRYTRGDKDHRRAHRGIDEEERRMVETSRRPKRAKTSW